MRPTTIRARRSGCPSARRFRRSRCRSPSVAPTRRRICSALFDDTLSRLLAVARVNVAGNRLEHPVAALRRGPAGYRHPRAARHSGAEPRDRLHRSRDRADRGARRDRWPTGSGSSLWAGRCRRARCVAALAGALLLTWTEKRWPEVQEAIIGVSFVLAASGALLLLASNPHGGEHLKELLVGQILWVNWPPARCWWRSSTRCFWASGSCGPP